MLSDHEKDEGAPATSIPLSRREMLVVSGLRPSQASPASYP